ncbi:hypothetical protein AeRB84_010742 [Aphanomyces euteiches]|nr:hypothetical protein AeRB84_010742 [Aphanomyces euteiches]
MSSLDETSTPAMDSEARKCDEEHLAVQMRQTEKNRDLVANTSILVDLWGARLESLRVARRDEPETSNAMKKELPSHIFILVHGNNGAPSDFDAIASRVRTAFGGDCFILQSQVNQGPMTRRGIARCGTELSIEILDQLLQFDVTPSPHRWLTIVGHSFGGLLARYCLPYIEDTFCSLGIELTSFATLCTPHLGSRRPGGSVWKELVKCVVHGVLSYKSRYGQTGMDLLLEGEPDSMLEQMSRPDSIFMRSLAKFRHRTLVGLVDGDHLVPRASSCLIHVHPNIVLREESLYCWSVGHSGFPDSFEVLANFDKVDMALLKDKEQCYTRHGIEHDLQCAENTTVETDVHCRQRVAIPQTILKGLESLSWRRLHVRVNYNQVTGSRCTTGRWHSINRLIRVADHNAISTEAVELVDT